MVWRPFQCRTTSHIVPPFCCTLTWSVVTQLLYVYAVTRWSMSRTFPHCHTPPRLVTLSQVVRLGHSVVSACVSTMPIKLSELGRVGKFCKLWQTFWPMLKNFGSLTTLQGWKVFANTTKIWQIIWQIIWQTIWQTYCCCRMKVPVYRRFPYAGLKFKIKIKFEN